MSWFVVSGVVLEELSALKPPPSHATNGNAELGGGLGSGLGGGGPGN